MFLFIAGILIVASFILGFYFGNRERNERLDIKISSNMDLVELIKNDELREEDQRFLADIILNSNVGQTVYLDREIKESNLQRRGNKTSFKDDEMEFLEFLNLLTKKYKVTVNNEETKMENNV